jgi:hypothetical protein
VAQPVVETLASWAADDVTLGQVEAALNDLRRTEERAAVRTTVLTLVAVINDARHSDEILEVVRQLGGRHPSRTVVVVPRCTPSSATAAPSASKTSSSKSGVGRGSTSTR